MTRLKNYLTRLQNWRKSKNWRSIAAYWMMFAFIMASSIGAGMIYPPAGLICFGATSAIVGYILGAE